MDTNIQLFKAAYYADLDALKEIIRNKEDLMIRIPTPGGSYDSYFLNQQVNISVLDILNWSNYGYYQWYDKEIYIQRSIDNEGVNHEISFNAALFYQKIIDCIEWICHTFKISDNYQLKDISKYRALRHFLDKNENWLDDEEMKDYLEQGFRKLDLDLINEAEKCNGIAVYHLMKEGASPYIDPIENDPEESSIFFILDASCGLYAIQSIAYVCDEKGFDSSDCYHMLASLYQFGVSKYILDIINLPLTKGST